MKKDLYQKLSVFHFSEEMKKRHTRKTLRAVIFGNFGAMNLGDEAILAGEIQELQKLPGMQVTVAARYPKEVAKLHKVHAISMYNLGEIRKTIKRADIVIVGGGGLINKVERSFIGFGYQLYMLFTYFLLPRLYHRKLYIMGIGVYANANPLIVSLALPLINYASLITVRDIHSYNFMKSKRVRAQLYKDNSFLMDLAPVSHIRQEAYFKEYYRPSRTNIGISLVKPDNPADEKRLIREMAAFLVNYHKSADFWFYPADSNPEYEGDKKMMDKVLMEAKKQVTEPIILHIVPTHYTPQIFFATIKLMNFMVAMRFHAAVFAYRQQVPFAGISYDTKCTSFIESVGQEALSLKTLTVAKITHNIL